MKSVHATADISANSQAVIGLALKQGGYLNLLRKRLKGLRCHHRFLSLCLSSGGQRAKVARKVEGDVDSSAESPDIRVSIAKRDAIVGIEHFRIDQNIKGGKRLNRRIWRPRA